MARESSRLILRRAFRRLETEVPGKVGRMLRSLRHPRSRWVRIPAALVLMLGGVFAFLPVLGFWMLPLGLLLIAADVKFLRRPVARFTLWGLARWTDLRRWWNGGRDADRPDPR
jgi:hypothetical protein